MTDTALRPPGDGEDTADGRRDAHLWQGKLQEAELLLSHAMSNGVTVPDSVVQGVLAGSAAARHGWTDDTTRHLLQALGTLAALLKPVSAESLRNTQSYRTHRSRLLLPATMALLAAVIVCYSTAAFLFSTFSATIRDSIAIANPLAVKLTDELESGLVSIDSPCSMPAAAQNPAQPAKPVDQPSHVDVERKYVVADLQTFAGAIRDMYGAARQMNRLYPFTSHQQDPIAPPDSHLTPEDYAAILELPPGLPNLARAAAQRICVYQRVRYFAQSTERDATIFTGAAATCVLPVLYALLGAGAYMLRRLEIELRDHTFVDEAHSPRFITAAIVGSVVGLFNFGQGVSVSPLAIAFLAGYAVDAFFHFLENLSQSIGRHRKKQPNGSSSPNGMGLADPD